MSVFVGDFLSGALESVSSMIKSFPGMWQMLNKYFINLILNLWILGGSSHFSSQTAAPTVCGLSR